ncbi:alpha amylase family protein [Dysgonomonas sp. 25]|uniref:alpha amylase family protein n=1 Tax=Dysgonomonas sp. 25 TaxID=2302933 RepID=UPI0013D3EFE2|nr:alpha amylase family protein [Dysgonomonas sp. 25]NDV69700.1 S-layer protein [Dysgonomonas sp. 25]
MKKIFSILLLVFVTTIIFACSSSDDDTPPWRWPDDEEETDAKPRYVWIDAAANFPDYADNKNKIREDLAKVKEVGFTDIVVDVRPTTGDVLFNTSACDQVRRVAYWDGPTYKLYDRTATWDYLQAFIDAGHEVGLKVHAGINTFVGGNTYAYGLGEDGILFRDASKKNWATSLNTTTGIKNTMDITDGSYRTKFFNPVNQDVQNYLLTIIGDLATYDLDGIFLDRCRYDELESDFSDYTKSKFEAYIGQTISNFPGDVVAPGTAVYPLPATLPIHFKKWLEFRAKVIHDFVEKARAKVKSVNGDIQFGVYVGGWYSTYYGVGVNWASPKYNTAQYHSQWASADYNKYGYADHLDFLLLGAYASADKIYGTGEWTVEGFCKQADAKILGDTKFAGGPDVGNWNVPAGTNVHTSVTNSIDAAYHAGNGYFLFDLIHVKKSDFWNDLKQGFDKLEPKK